ncbi:hypothetical protein [Bacillus alkalisoli]|uniref:hypothetical protein n=1 Tax=Bacillus alkalisoli TaxID=2011008 RepID=UPI000C23B92A|nr:hypothetical protein [Bacillus alkalisoli]
MTSAHIVDSCGRSGERETPQERMRRGGSRPARGKRRYARKSTALSTERYHKDGQGLILYFNKSEFITIVN